jgi:hypothetical protein
MVFDEDRPLVAGQLTGVLCEPSVLVEAPFVSPSPEHECPGISGIGQKVVDRRITGRSPADSVGSSRSTWNEKVVLPQRNHHLAGRSELVETPEDDGDGLDDCLIGIQHDMVVFVIDKTDQQALAKLAFGSFVQQPGG